MKKQIDNIEQIEINKLVPAEYNPRRLTKKQHDDIKASLEKYGFVDPVIVNTHPDRQNVIIGGHQRVKVWKSMGNDTAPCVLVACDIKEEQELNVRLNKNTGEFDWDMLANHFDQADLIEWGFEHHEFGVIETLEPEETEGDDDVPESAPPITVLGDIYELGGVHRVMCGDSLSSDAVERLMDGQKADLIFTDPPYNIAEKGKNVASNVKEGKAYNVLKNSKWDYGFIVEDFLNNILAFTTETASFFIFTSHFLFGNIQKWMDDNLDYNNYCVWCKPNPMPSLTKKRFTWATELINYGSKNKHFFNFKSEGHLFNYLVENSPAHTTQHPTEKPLKVLMYFLDVLSDKNSIILDSFCGSGSTLISCEKLGRKCYGMELDPKYCDVIVKRYVEFCKANNRPYEVKRNGQITHEF